MKINPIPGPDHQKKVTETIRKIGKKKESPKVVNK